MIDQVFEILKENNLKLTPQRKEIVKILWENRGHHLEIEVIYNLVASKGKKCIGLATVYRTMELFNKIGLISRITMEKSPAKYELNVFDKLNHHHLICLKCGQVQEISDDIASEFKTIIAEEADFKVADKPMKIYGYCSKCREP
ncbi:Fur family transcriptional regulator [Lutispora sp.]|uniref:Fur family transcriptional regulator n=1 Tax=Lutispora sp. TaxID=2828727 RepID=UPI0035688AAA